MMKLSVIAVVGFLAAALGLFFTFPTRDTYLFAPGVMSTYLLNGGVHGKNPLGWGKQFFAIASMVNLIIYWFVIYVTVQLWYLIVRRRTSSNE